MSGQVRIGIVGCGRLVEFGYVAALARVPELQAVAVADPDPLRRAHVARLLGLEGPGTGFAGSAAMTEGAELDAVVIASPAGAHVADATQVARAGVTALVEKPPAPDLAGTAALASLRPAPYVGFNRRFVASARTVRDARHHHRGGCDLDLRISYRRRSWRALAVHDDALLDLGPHLVDWTMWITGSPISAVRCSHLDADRAVVTVRLDQGSARLVAHCDRPHRERIELRTASGALLARHRAGGLGAILRRREPEPHPLVDSLAGQLAAFVTVIRGGTAPDLAGVADALAVMEVIDAARASAAGGGRWASVTPSRVQ